MTATEPEHVTGQLVRMPSTGGRLTIPELKREAEEVRELVKAVLIEGSDYGQIPGTQKPTLFKSGAETLLRRFGFGHRMEPTEIERDEENRKYGATYRCYVHVISDPEMVVASCDGYCGYDEPDREAHNTKWGKAVPRAPWNTIIKMAQKRALIGATLQATATSGLFTQDLEDMGNATDQRDWYEHNGWTGADEEVTSHAAIVERAKALPELAQQAFGAWYKTEGMTLSKAITRAEADAMNAKLDDLENGEVPPPDDKAAQGAPDATEAPADTSDAQAPAEAPSDAPGPSGDDSAEPVDEGAISAKVEALKADEVDTRLKAANLPTTGRVDERRARLADYWSDQAAKRANGG